jgi:hypothetical protein
VPIFLSYFVCVLYFCLISSFCFSYFYFILLFYLLKKERKKKSRARSRLLNFVKMFSIIDCMRKRESVVLIWRGGF